MNKHKVKLYNHPKPLSAALTAVLGGGMAMMAVSASAADNTANVITGRNYLVQMDTSLAGRGVDRRIREFVGPYANAALKPEELGKVMSLIERGLRQAGYRDIEVNIVQTAPGLPMRINVTYDDSQHLKPSSDFDQQRFMRDLQQIWDESHQSKPWFETQSLQEYTSTSKTKSTAINPAAATDRIYRSHRFNDDTIDYMDAAETREYLLNYGVNYANSKLNSALNSNLESTVQANSELSLSYDADGDTSLSGKVLVPFYNEPKLTAFAQAGITESWQDRKIGHIGAGIRYYPNAIDYDLAGDWMLGLNTVYDYDWDRYHQRLSVGAEVMYDRFKASANLYTRLSGWKDSPDFAAGMVQERPANGADLRVQYTPDFFPSMAIKGSLAYWQGDDVAVFGDPDDRADNPVVYGLGLEWNPVQAFSLSYMHEQTSTSQSNDSIQASFNLPLEERALRQAFTPATAGLKYTIAGSRNEFIDRDYKMPLQYRSTPGKFDIGSCGFDPEKRDYCFRISNGLNDDKGLNDKTIVIKPKDSCVLLDNNGVYTTDRHGVIVSHVDTTCTTSTTLTVTAEKSERDFEITMIGIDGFILSATPNELNLSAAGKQPLAEIILKPSGAGTKEAYANRQVTFYLDKKYPGKVVPEITTTDENGVAHAFYEPSTSNEPTLSRARRQVTPFYDVMVQAAVDNEALESSNIKPVKISVYSSVTANSDITVAAPSGALEDNGIVSQEPLIVDYGRTFTIKVSGLNQGSQHTEVSGVDGVISDIQATAGGQELKLQQLTFKDNAATGKRDYYLTFEAVTDKQADNIDLSFAYETGQVGPEADADNTQGTYQGQIPIARYALLLQSTGDEDLFDGNKHYVQAGKKYAFAVAGGRRGDSFNYVISASGREVLSGSGSFAHSKTFTPDAAGEGTAVELVFTASQIAALGDADNLKFTVTADTLNDIDGVTKEGGVLQVSSDQLDIKVNPGADWGANVGANNIDWNRETTLTVSGLLPDSNLSNVTIKDNQGNILQTIQGKIDADASGKAEIVVNPVSGVDVGSITVDFDFWKNNAEQTEHKSETLDVYKYTLALAGEQSSFATDRDYEYTLTGGRQHDDYSWSLYPADAAGTILGEALVSGSGSFDTDTDKFTVNLPSSALNAAPQGTVSLVLKADGLNSVTAELPIQLASTGISGDDIVIPETNHGGSSNTNDVNGEGSGPGSIDYFTDWQIQVNNLRPGSVIELQGAGPNADLVVTQSGLTAITDGGAGDADGKADGQITVVMNAIDGRHHDGSDKTLAVDVTYQALGNQTQTVSVDDIRLLTHRLVVDYRFSSSRTSKSK